MPPAVAAIGLLLVLHRPDGIPIMISPAHIVSLQVTSEAAGRGQNRFAPGKAMCIVELVSHRLASVLEDCATVQRLLEEAR
jgi:hypothetical protein